LRWSHQSKQKTPFDCETCTDKDFKYRNCNNYKGLPEELRADNGVGDVKDIANEYGLDLTKKVVSLVNGKEAMRLYECPLTYITQDTSELIRIMYLMDNTNQMYFRGSLSDQPNWLIEAYEIFKTETYYLQKMDIDNGK